MKYVEIYGAGFLREFYEKKEIIKLVKAVATMGSLLYTNSNAIGTYSMVFAVVNGHLDLFKTLARLTLRDRSLAFEEL